MTLGERGYNLERLFNLREGLTQADDSLPERLTKTPQPVRGKHGVQPENNGKQADAGNEKTGYVVPLEKMLKQYYKVRGWDTRGVPKQKTLKRLGIEV